MNRSRIDAALIDKLLVNHQFGSNSTAEVPPLLKTLEQSQKDAFATLERMYRIIATNPNYSKQDIVGHELTETPLRTTTEAWILRVLDELDQSIEMINHVCTQSFVLALKLLTRSYDRSHHHPQSSKMLQQTISKWSKFQN